MRETLQGILEKMRGGLEPADGTELEQIVALLATEHSGELAATGVDHNPSNKVKLLAMSQHAEHLEARLLAMQEEAAELETEREATQLELGDARSRFADAEQRLRDATVAAQRYTKATESKMGAAALERDAALRGEAEAAAVGPQSALSTSGGGGVALAALLACAHPWAVLEGNAHAARP